MAFELSILADAMAFCWGSSQICSRILQCGEYSVVQSILSWAITTTSFNLLFIRYYIICMYVTVRKKSVECLDT